MHISSAAVKAGHVKAQAAPAAGPEAEHGFQVRDAHQQYCSQSRACQGTEVSVPPTCAWSSLVTAICALISTACRLMTGLSDCSPVSTLSAAARFPSFTSTEASTRANAADPRYLQYNHQSSNHLAVTDTQSSKLSFDVCDLQPDCCVVHESLYKSTTVSESGILQHHANNCAHQ
jgi:hypothetical protein